KDTRERNPDDERTQTASGSEDLGIHFNTRGVWTLNKGWVNNIDYVLSASNRDKHSFYEQLLVNAFALYSMSMTNGALLSNRPGQSIYNMNASELTSIPAGVPSLNSTFLLNEYFSRYDILGNVVTTFAK